VDPLFLGALALTAVVALLVISPSDTWETNSELWYEQLAPRTRRDTFSEELIVMRLEAEQAAIVRSQAEQSARPAGRTVRPVPSPSR
jgi:hypothetical protein